MNMKPNKKWVPKLGEKYWSVSESGWSPRFLVHSWTIEHENTNGLWMNTFKTKREAQEAARKINSILRGE